MPTRIILVGGFLGAGKTTLLTKAARMLIDRGLRAAVISNDQSAGLVDTALIRQNDIPVAEVTSGCFCCNFPDLLTAIQTLNQENPYDVILAEPVGSCTDLMATVVRPLQAYHADQFVVAPLTVLLDSTRDLSQFPSLVGYLYEKQLAEADILVLSKSDLLAQEEQAQRINALRRVYPDAQLLALSAASGDGLDAWLDICLSRTSPATARLPLDYQQYAEAEAALGWLNASGTLTADTSFSPRAWVADGLETLQRDFAGRGMELAHLKAYVGAASGAWKASITQRASDISWDIQSENRARSAEFLLNVRVNAAPAQIEAAVRDALDTVSGAHGLRAELTSLKCFSPAPPKPTFRLMPE